MQDTSNVFVISILYIWLRPCFQDDIRISSGPSVINSHSSIRAFVATAAACAAAVLCDPAAATSITLGAQHFASGQLLGGGVAEFTAPQGGAPPPFGLFIGGDTAAIGGVFSASWTFNFVPGAASSATITFGIFDHDSAATGNQLASFSIDGIDLTAALNPLVEAPGIGTQVQYDVFTLTLTGSALAALADGTATFFLQLAGPGLCGVAGTSVDCSPNAGNGAGLDFSTLNFTNGTTTVPEPGTLALLAIGLFAIGLLGAGLRLRRR